MSPNAKELAAHVLHLAKSDPDALATAERGFAKRRSSAGLFFELDDLKPMSLRPVPLTRAEDVEIRNATSRIQSLLEKLISMYRDDPAVRAFFPAYAAVDHWLLPDHDMRPPSGVFRLDGLLTNGRYRIMEVSAGDPGGVIKAGAELALWREAVVDLLGLERPSFGDQPFGEDPLMFVRFLVDAHQQQFGRRPDGAAVVGLDYEYVNEVALVIGGFHQLGIPTKHVDATELRRNLRFGITAGEFTLSLAFSKLDQFRLIRTPEARDYLDAIAAGEICAAPTLLAHCLLDDKSILAFLSDTKHSSVFTTEERDVIDRHIPWTRVTRPGKCTTPSGDLADLAAYAIEEQDHLVLKPNDRTRGEGVLIGPETDPAHWQTEVTAAIQDGKHVLQEFIPLPEIDIPFGNPINVTRMKHGIDSFMFGDKFAGYMCRASVDTIINVGRRGQHVPVIIEDI